MIINLQNTEIVYAFYGNNNYKINVIKNILNYIKNRDIVKLSNDKFKLNKNNKNNLLFIHLKNNTKFEIKDGSVVEFSSENIKVLNNYNNNYNNNSIQINKKKKQY